MSRWTNEHTIGVRPMHRWKSLDDGMGAFAAMDRCDVCKATRRRASRASDAAYYLASGRRWQGRGAPPCEVRS